MNYCGNHQLVKNAISFLDINVCPASVVQRANPIAYVDAGDAPVAFLLVHGVPTPPRDVYRANHLRGGSTQFVISRWVRHCNFCRAC